MHQKIDSTHSKDLNKKVKILDKFLDYVYDKIVTIRIKDVDSTIRLRIIDVFAIYLKKFPNKFIN